MASTPLGIFLALLLLLPSCATFHRRYGPAESCSAFCREINSCAAKAHHANLGPLLCRTARCETGDRCTGDIDSTNGLYGGAFQFLESTWKTQCEPLFPAIGLRQCSGGQARYDTCCAAACAAEVVARRGVGDWPVCGPRAKRGQRQTGMMN